MQLDVELAWLRRAKDLRGAVEQKRVLADNKQRDLGRNTVREVTGFEERAEPREGGGAEAEGMRAATPDVAGLARRAVSVSCSLAYNDNLLVFRCPHSPSLAEPYTDRGAAAKALRGGAASLRGERARAGE